MKTIHTTPPSKPENNDLPNQTRVAFVLLMLVFAALIAIGHQLFEQNQHQLQARFESEAQRITSKVSIRVVSYTQLLRGAAGFFAGSTTVTREKWRSYVERLDLDQNYRGLQGLGFSLLIPSAQLANHIKAMRAEGFPDYVVKPAGARDFYTSIIFLEPFSGRNLRAFGYDMFSEATRHTAMEIARDTGATTLSGKVKLLQETKVDVQAGILAYHPIYANGTLLQTIEQRRAALIGWVYSPYRMNDLIEAALADELINVRLEIFDDQSTNPEALLFDSAAKLENLTDQVLTHLTPIVMRVEMEGRFWTLRYTPLPGFAAYAQLGGDRIELAGLSIIAVLVLIITWAFVNTRRTATRLAVNLTASLRKSEDQLQVVMKSAQMVIVLADSAGHITFINEAALKLLGYEPDELEGKFLSLLIDSREFSRIPEFIEATLQGEKRVSNWLLKTKSGQSMLFELSTQLLPDGRLLATGSDITERVESQIRLLESEKRFRVVADAAPVLIWMSGTDKSCFWFNKVWLNFTGRSLDEEMGNGWTEGVHPDDLQSCLERYINHFDRREEFRTYYRLRRHDGEYRWVHDNGVPRFDETGQFLGYIGSCNDVTEQRLALAKLQETEERWKFALEGAGDGVWDWNIATDEVTFSKRWYEIQGFDEGSIGPAVSEWQGLVHPDDLAVADSVLKAHFDGESSSFSCEHRVRCKNGEYKWILGRGMVVSRDAEGKPLRAIGTHTDITDRKLAEADRERLQAIIMEAPDFIASSDMDAHLTFLNPAGARLVGLPENVDLTNLEIADMHPEWAAKRVLEEGISTVLNHQGYWQGETALWNRLEEREIPVSQLLLVHRDKNGNPQQLSTIMRDITSFKQTEQVLQHAKEQAENLARSKSEFLANMSHEIRTPMNAIIGFSQLTLNTPLSTQQYDYLDKILGASQHLLSILNDILDFSKLDSDRMVILTEPFNLDELLHNLDSLFYGRAKEKSLEFNLQLANDVPRNLLGDALRLQQILVNLISNSIKFTEQGFIRLQISVAAPETDDRIMLKFVIEDSGIGISDEQRQHLFQPFIQADSSITRRFGGTGLGLVISRKLAQMMNSDIVCQSVQGEGSQFSFVMLFGVDKKALGAISSKPSRQVITVKQLKQTAKALTNIRVLLVEDNPLNQQVASEFLRKAGLRVVIANDGQQALDILDHNDFDVVLMDIQMPIMDGLQATRQLRNQARFADLPIIAMSAGVTLDEQAHCESAGMTDFIAKPIDPLSMIEKLANALRVASSNAATTQLNKGSSSDSGKQGQLELVGFDTERLQLLENLMGSHEKVLQTLLQFAEDNQAIEQEINNWLAQDERDAACERLHGLRGVAANLGAVRLAETSDALEKTLKKGDNGSGELRHFCVAWQAVARTLGSITLNTVPAVSSPSSSLSNKLAQLQDLLKDDRLIPVELLNDLPVGHSALQVETVNRLCKAIGNYDYRKALEIIKELQ